jgi:hypothetical protein
VQAHLYGHVPPLPEEIGPKRNGVRAIKKCMYCAAMFTGHFSAMRICGDCNKQRIKARSKALSAVAKAIREGKMERADTKYCVDCGAFATVHDHRNYLEPLKVDPVCTSCNQKRGPGHWMPK